MFDFDFQQFKIMCLWDFPPCLVVALILIIMDGSLNKILKFSNQYFPK